MGPVLGKSLTPKALFDTVGMAHRASKGPKLCAAGLGAGETEHNREHTSVPGKHHLLFRQTDRTELKALLFGSVNNATKNLTKL